MVRNNKIPVYTNEWCPNPLVGGTFSRMLEVGGNVLHDPRLNTYDESVRPVGHLLQETVSERLRTPVGVRPMCGLQCFGSIFNPYPDPEDP